MIEVLIPILTGILTVLLFAIGIGYLTEKEEQVFKKEIENYVKNEIGDQYNITFMGKNTAFTRKGYIAASDREGNVYLSLHNIYEKTEEVIPKLTYKLGDAGKRVLDYAISFAKQVYRHEKVHIEEGVGDHPSGETYVQLKSYMKSLEEGNKEGVIIGHEVMKKLNPIVASNIESTVPEISADEGVESSYRPKSVQKEMEYTKELYKREAANIEFVPDIIPDKKAVGSEWRF